MDPRACQKKMTRMHVSLKIEVSHECGKLVIDDIDSGAHEDRGSVWLSKGQSWKRSYMMNPVRNRETVRLQMRPREGVS